MIDLQVSDIRTFIPSSDFELSKDFYGALGFEVDAIDVNLALLSVGDQAFYLQRYYVKDWAENSMLFLTVADAQACFEQIDALLSGGRFPGARVAAPKREAYGAVVTYMWDPAGVLLHLAQWDE